MGQNIMSAANELRPVQVSILFSPTVSRVRNASTRFTLLIFAPLQARCNLEAMMKHQLELRREEAAAIHKFVSEVSRCFESIDHLY